MNLEPFARPQCALVCRGRPVLESDFTCKDLHFVTSYTVSYRHQEVLSFDWNAAAMPMHSCDSKFHARCNDTKPKLTPSRPQFHDSLDVCSMCVVKGSLHGYQSTDDDCTDICCQ